MNTNKTFRLFISSTFSDFTAERKLLQTKVFPHMQKYCTNKGNYSFQPIDLRWGISAEAQLDQKTLELCLNEVRACKSHPNPNFLIMAGDRYGWIPLPYAIEKSEFQILCSYMNDKEAEKILEWYREDLNQIPVSYILKERSGIYEKYEVWEATETEIRDLLQNSVRALGLDDERKRKYFLSATEAEVEEGIFNYLQLLTSSQEKLIERSGIDPTIDSKYVFGFIRRIENTLQKPGLFIDAHRQEIEAFQQHIATAIPEENLLEASPRLLNESELDTAYLDVFEKAVTQFLERSVDDFFDGCEEVEAFVEELEAQTYYAQSKRNFFQGRKDSLEVMDSYICGSGNEPLVIYGPSGSGKSALMSKAIAESQEKKECRVIYRFIGATPNSSGIKELFSSIFDELGLDVSFQKDDSFEAFSEQLYQELVLFGSNGDKSVIFLDAVDQLVHTDQFLWLPEVLPENLKIVISALADDKYPKDSRYLETLRHKTANLYEIPSFEEPLDMLYSTLSIYERTLQPEQEAYVLRQYEKNRTPLYLGIAVQELRHWRSSDVIPETETAGDSKKKGTKALLRSLWNGKGLTETTKMDSRIVQLAQTQQGIISEFIENLHLVYHHDQRLVDKILGYLYASFHGLSEHELLQLLSCDQAFVQAMAPETWHENTTKELPVVHWSRLHSQLKSFLSQKSQNGEDLLYFFHREFEDVIAHMPSRKKEHEEAVMATQQMIVKCQNEAFDANRWGKLYATLVTEYGLRYDNESKLDSCIAFIAALKNDEWTDAWLSYVGKTGVEHDAYNRNAKAIIYMEVTEQVALLLYKADPERWVQTYMTALNNLASPYGKINRLDDAVALLEKKLEILQVPTDEIIEAVKDSFVSDDRNGFSFTIDDNQRWVSNYLSTLSSLAIMHDKAGRYGNARGLLEQKLETVKPFFEQNPVLWLEEYLSAISNLAFTYKKQNLLDEAIVMEEESLKIHEGLYAGNSDRWAAPYTRALSNLAVSYQDKNDFEKALKLDEKSYEIRKSLYEKDPDRWLEDYARVANSLAFTYAQNNCHDEAVALAEETLAMREVLYQKDPDRWAEEYGTSLNTLAMTYAENNRMEEALPLEWKALEVLKKQYEKDPTRWVDDVVNIHKLLGFLLMQAQQMDLVTEVEIGLLDIYRLHYKEDLEKWMYDYTELLYQLANRYKENRQFDHAANFEEEALNALKSHYERDPQRWAERYVTAVNNLAFTHSHRGHEEEANRFLHDSFHITSAEYGRDPDGWLERFSMAHNNLAASYLNMQAFKQALPILQKQYELLVSHYGPDHPKTQEVHSYVAAIKDAISGKQEAPEDNEQPEGNVTLADLLKIAKFNAMITGKDVIESDHILTALALVELNSFSRSVFSQFANLDEVDANWERISASGMASDAQHYIEMAESAENKPFTENIEGLIVELEKIFADKYMGIFR